MVRKSWSKQGGGAQAGELEEEHSEKRMPDEVVKVQDASGTL